MLFIVIFFVTCLFSRPVLSVEIITHWVPHEVYGLGLPDYEALKFYEFYTEPKADELPELEKKAKELYKEGRRLRDEGEKEKAESKFQESKDIFQKIIDGEPKLPQTYFWLGLNERALGNTTEAEKYFIRYKELAPSIIKPYLMLAEHYYGLGKLEDARGILNEALRNVKFEKAYHKYLVYNNLGIAYFYLQNYTQAEFHLQRALENLVSGKYPDTYVKTAYQLAKVCTVEGDIANDNVIYEDALDVLLKIEPLIKKDNKLLFNMYALKGYVNGKLKKYAEAENDLKKALGLYGWDITTKRNLKRIQKINEQGIRWGNRIARYGGFFVSVLAVMFLVVVIATFFDRQPFGHNKTIGEKTMRKGATIAFTFMVIGILMVYMLPYITSIKWGGLEINLQNPVPFEPIQLERPVD